MNLPVGKVLALAKDCVFPIFCLGCEREGQWVCANCASGIEMSGVFFCPVCHSAQPGGRCCVGCASQSYLASHVAITPYKEHGLIGKMIHALKYQYVEGVIDSLEPVLRVFIEEHTDIFDDVDALVPVPLHTRRFAERGFNQAELLARCIGKVCNKPVVYWVERTRYTPHQALLARLERIKNVADAFTVTKEVSVSGKNVLLIDDVFTTGSTLQECAKAVREGGVGEVSGFSLGRG